MVTEPYVGNSVLELAQIAPEREKFGPSNQSTYKLERSALDTPGPGEFVPHLTPRQHPAGYGRGKIYNPTTEKLLLNAEGSDKKLLH